MSGKPSPQELIALKGQEMRVDKLLELFSVRVRYAWTVREVTQALADVGLTTLPDFSTCNPYTAVQLVPLAVAPAETGDDEAAAQAEPLPSAALPQRLLIGDLPAACGGVASVTRNADLSQATYLMRHHGYAQIPVTSNMTTLHGVVTWRSLALMYENGKPSTLENAMQQDSLPVADTRQEFFSCLPQLTEHGYLLVRGQDGGLSGIVTHRTVIERFQHTARPFFLLGEIESLLRRWLGTALDGEAIRAVQNKRKVEDRTGKVEDLAFGDYVYLLNGNQRKQSMAEQADRNWAALGHPSLNREQFIHHLERIKAIRNRIAHFDAEPLPTADMRELTAFTALLRDYVG
ncbi:CBS domain-containing protein [Streptomyces sp. NPDC048506]|uniref:CBS domain-containing protein n=1 Tax=Streptomyces sp. NPDC048506 TaxID=3155028 RepID=UPI0034294059